mmetsp:Transcript_4272/g.6515  ORF Transcript_4272/g.6515 Transcript_4272/m.6515 type:complete len:93 (-) Transcript_4272:24-302(-)
MESRRYYLLYTTLETVRYWMLYQTAGWKKGHDKLQNTQGQDWKQIMPTDEEVMADSTEHCERKFSQIHQCILDILTPKLDFLYPECNFRNNS